MYFVNCMCKKGGIVYIETKEYCVNYAILCKHNYVHERIQCCNVD